jgi:hypothetical protein
VPSGQVQRPRSAATGMKIVPNVVTAMPRRVREQVWGCVHPAMQPSISATHPYPRLSRTILCQHTVSSSVALIHPVRSKRLASTI